MIIETSEQPTKRARRLVNSKTFRIFALLNALCEKVDRNLRVPISRIVLASLFEPRDFDFNNGTN